MERAYCYGVTACRRGLHDTELTEATFTPLSDYNYVPMS